MATFTPLARPSVPALMCAGSSASTRPLPSPSIAGKTYEPLTGDVGASVDRGLPPHLHAVALGASIGETAKETAARLGLTENTVRSYRAEAQRRCSVDSIGKLVAALLLSGEITVTEMAALAAKRGGAA